jgi:hypothetical protein
VAYKENQIKITELQNDNVLLFRDFLIDEQKNIEAQRQLDVENATNSESKKQRLLKELLIRGEIERLTILNKFLDQSDLAYKENLIKIQELQREVDLLPQNWLDDIEDFKGAWEKFLDETFGTDVGGRIAEFGKALGAFVGEFGSLLNESTAIQLSNIDKQLDRLNKRRDDAKNALDNELELQKLGLANSADLKKNEVDNLLKEEERLNAEKEKLQAQAQRRQILADTAAQGASLITSSINIIKGFSNIPVVGLPLGIAAVASLFAFFAKNKVDALKATRLYTGARKIDDHFGYAQRHGDTDLPGQGSGYRLIREKDGHDTNILISGREMLIPERISLQNQEFFDKLRLGWFNGVDLMGRMNISSNISIPKGGTVNNVIVNAPKPERQVIRQFIDIGKGKYSLVTITPDMRDGTIIEVK